MRPEAPELAQWHVDIARFNVDQRQPGGVRGVTRDVARALAMAHDPQDVGPLLIHGWRGTIVVESELARSEGQEAYHE